MLVNSPTSTARLANPRHAHSGTKAAIRQALATVKADARIQVSCSARLSAGGSRVTMDADRRPPPSAMRPRLTQTCPRPGRGPSVDQAQLAGSGYGLRAFLDLEFGEDVVDVALDRVERQVELGRDFLVGFSVGD